MEENRKLPILSVVRTGNPQFQRFVIEDDQNHRWTGQEFGKKGAFFASQNDAGMGIHHILKGFFEGVQPVRYVAPVAIEVFSQEPIPVAKVIDYLSRASSLLLNTPEYGNGPGSSLVLPVIEWGRIDEQTGG